LDSKLTDAYLSIGIIQFDQQLYEEAVQSFDQAIENEAVHLAEAYFYRAEAKYALDDSEGACADWKDAGDLGDDEGKAFYFDYCVRRKDKKNSKRRGNREVISF